MEIDDLEAQWEQRYENCDEEEGENAFDSEGGKGSLSKSLGVEGNAPVHMDLFYNNEEYSGPVYDENSANNVGHAC